MVKSPRVYKEKKKFSPESLFYLTDHCARRSFANEKWTKCSAALGTSADLSYSLQDSAVKTTIHTDYSGVKREKSHQLI